MGRWILHVDVDAFFASVEQALNPALRGRPVIVGGAGPQRTVVISCSYEARRLGVRKAMSTLEARRCCPQACFLAGDARLYQRAARGVWDHLRELPGTLEQVSLDEAYVELTGTAWERRDLLPLAEALCRKVWRTLALPLSVGMGSSKLMARLATRLARPRGCLLLLPDHERRLLESLLVEALPGVGRKVGELLHRFGLHRVRDLKLVSRDLLVETFGCRGAQLHAFAHGQDTRPVEAQQRPRSISREFSFPEGARQFGALRGMAAYLLDRAMKELLTRGLGVRCFSLHLRYCDRVRVEQSRSFKEPLRHEANLIPWAEVFIKKLFTRRVPVHVLGITLSRLVPLPGFQPGLFSSAEETRQEALDQAVQRLRERHGFGVLMRGAAIDLLDDLPHGRDGFRQQLP